MRFALFVSALALCLLTSPGGAAEAGWITYVNRADRFALNLPTQPRIEETIYLSQHKSPWKARRYTAERDGYRYVMTVVDMSSTVLTPQNDAFRNAGRPGTEKRGMIAYAASQLRQTGKVTLDTYNELQVIPGHMLEIELPDGRHNIVEIHAHGPLLYILECISPRGAVPGYDVHSSIEFLDAEGNVVRYEDNGRDFLERIPRAPATAGAAAAGREVAAEANAPLGEGWITYVNRQDRFALNLPGQPRTEEFTYVSQAKSPWKARRHTAERDGYRYVMTVVDMSTSWLTPDKDQFRNVERPGNEKRGAMAYAATQLRQTGKVTLDTYMELQVIPGHMLEIELPDGRQNVVEIHRLGDFLYILECISPPGALPGYDVQTSLELLDADGNVPRYQDNDRSFPDLVPVASRTPHASLSR
jgi:hypothetical protein